MNRIIEAQARHESGNYTSPLYRRNNNMFGMRHARGSRAATQLGYEVETDKYRVYRSSRESIRDMIDWLQNQNFPVFPDTVKGALDYAAELRRRGFYTAPLGEYEKNLIFYYNNL